MEIGDKIPTLQRIKDSYSGIEFDDHMEVTGLSKIDSNIIHVKCGMEGGGHLRTGVYLDELKEIKITNKNNIL